KTVTSAEEGPTVSVMAASWSDVERDVVALDRSVYAAIAETPTPTLDVALRRLSDAADNSKIWLAIAAGIAAVGGSEGRRTAALGVAAIGITSATVNLAGKRLFDRARPDRAGADVPVLRQVRMPTSTSFPSGHSASAFAFANAVGGQWPVAGFPLRALATAVAYSRVHTGVHFPSDVIIGSIIGAAIGDVVTAVGRRYWTKPL
ncbi:MAG TPA: phosphatase PAP2 family protein, partial [Acidimicrobiales bacterium]